MDADPKSPGGPLAGVGEGRRSLVFWAAACLLAPLALAALLWCDTGLLQAFTRAYTSYNLIFSAGDNVSVSRLSADQKAQAQRILLERMAAQTLVFSWHARFKAPLLALALSFAAALFSRRRRPGKGLARAARFSAVSIALALLAVLPGPAARAAVLSLAFAALSGLVFSINFSLPGKTRMPGLTKAGLLLSPGVSHVFAPVLHAGLFAAAFFPGSDRAERVLKAIGRAAASIFGFGLLSFALLSFFPPGLSPGVTRLIPVQGLYGVLVDQAHRRLVVTSKHSRPGRAANAALSLDDPLAPGRLFELPSREVEDLALDPEADRIYHVDRTGKRLLVMGAGSLALERVVPLAVKFSGSAHLALVPKAGRLFVGWENGGLSAVDLSTGKIAGNMGVPCNPNIAADGENSRLYVHLHLLGEIVALDAETLAVTAKAPSPRSDERPVISEKRRELYIPDILGGRIWVYSIPKLTPLGKLPAQVGVRALAPDDRNGLLLSVSMVTGDLRVQDPASGRVLSSFHLAPYCRRMALDTQRRRAYVTLTQNGLYEVEY